MGKTTDITKTENYKKGFKDGRKFELDWLDEKATWESNMFLNGYKAGFRDHKLGRKKIPHETMDGFCCACDYDQVTLENKYQDRIDELELRLAEARANK